MKSNRKLFIWIICGFLSSAGIAHGDEIVLIHQTSKDSIARIDVIRAGGYDCIALADFCRSLNLSFSQNILLKQFHIKSRKTIVFTAMNPFIRINDEIRQMPTAVLYQNRQFYVPLKYLLPCIQDALPFPLTYQEDNRELAISSFHTVIKNLQVDEKQNGIIIRLQFKAYVPAANIYTSESNGWFYVDIFGGQLERADEIPVVNNSRIVSEIMKLQLSRDTARFGFHVTRPIKDKTLSMQENPFGLSISLRTLEEIPPDLLAELAKEREKWKIDLVIIDPGHGGKDPGAIGKSGYYEKHLTLAIAQEIRDELVRRLKIKVLMTRDADVFVPLEERTQFANRNNGKLFISIHVDSNPDRAIHGHTVYFMGPAKTDAARQVAQLENSVIEYEDSKKKYAGMSDAAFILAANAQNSFNKESQAFAELVDNNLNSTVQSHSIGVRQAGFYVLYGASMPNLLLETGFSSNRQDEKRLKEKSTQRLIAKAITQSVKEFKERYEMVH